MSTALPTATERYAVDSRYRKSKLHLDSTGPLRLGLWIAPALDMAQHDWYLVKSEDLPGYTDVGGVVSYGCRLDLISYKVYGTSIYWWIIAYVNHIKSPLTELRLGQNLKIPKMGAIVSALVGA